ncbi:MAG: TlpA family protein disulfide reductase, partial [Acidobacteria bacterium]|nr:TlpA family protein disulfide reductase [Acidobacteriota bacterium]
MEKKRFFSYFKIRGIKYFKYFCYLLPLFCFLFLSCSSSQDKFEPKNESLNESSWRISAVNGDSALTLEDLKGKISVLHFFASWCPPCRTEFPDFIKWEKANSNDSSLLIVPISLDKNKKAANDFYSKSEQDLLCYFDKGEAANFFKIKGIPATLILDASGNVVFKREG